MNKKEFLRGMKSSVPIFLGYLGVSVGFGSAAYSKGIPLPVIVLISLTNLTSAGQFAGIGIIGASGTLFELFVSQFMINSRYFLMSISLGQQMKDFSLPKRLLCAFSNTDEIFAVANGEEKLSFSFYAGLSVPPYIGWALGTLIGGVASMIVPPELKCALNIMLYAMFVAIVLPKCRKTDTLICVLITAAISTVIYFVPVFSFITDGFAIIISTLISSVFCALVFREAGE
ncbi:MAG: AzlC family ABC transporter permease [Firmicutes bacterium]|nr:AzlC family ABC transporter permease [Candidatus Colimorpha enterica]